MSRYFFDLHNRDGSVRDEQGMEFNSRQSVAKEVNRILLDVARDELRELAQGQVSVTVRNDSGQTISTANLTFSSQWFDKLPGLDELAEKSD